jgi:hypothetical protein
MASQHQTLNDTGKIADKNIFLNPIQTLCICKQRQKLANISLILMFSEHIDCLTIKKKTQQSLKMSATIYHSAQNNISEDFILQICHLFEFTLGLFNDTLASGSTNNK